jgi:predicted nucleotidyltransferase component of viral defense system
MERILMINLKELKKIAVKGGVPQAIVEKDLALSVALKAITQQALAKHVVFKGGTAIRKIYFKEARFSEDLDFTVLGIDKRACLEMLGDAIEGISLEGVKFEKIEEERTPEGLKVTIKFTGPLAQAQRIRFDFNFRQNLVEKSAMHKLIDSYELGEVELFALSLEELFAEKIHALISRSAPRDLYDVWFLFGKNVELDAKMVKAKFAYYGENFDLAKLEGKINEYENDWQRDLRHLMGTVPEFKILANDVISELKRYHD